jgi:translation initiation factor 4A
VIAILQRLDLSQCQALIIVPTHELSNQIVQLVSSFTVDGLKIHECVGGERGMKVPPEKEILLAGIHMVVGTPGRIHDMICRHALSLAYLEILVLDETNDLLG